MAALVYAPDQVLWRGLRLAGMSAARIHNHNRETQLEDFKGCYGAAPVVIAQIWEDLQKTTNPAARIDPLGKYKKRSIHLKNFLRTHHFVKHYPTETLRKVQTGNSTKTVRNWCWYFLERIQALKDEKVRAEAGRRHRVDFGAPNVRVVVVPC